MDRRQFVTWSTAGAFLLAEPGPSDGAAADALSPWIRIGSDGRVTLITTVSDMGQGSRTGQIQVLADELDVPWEAVSVEHAPDAEPYRREGSLYTGGSHSIEHYFDTLRRAGATARGQFVAAAAARWGAQAADCRAELGQVTHGPSGRRLAYGALAAQAACVTPAAEPPLKPRAAWRYVGKSLPVRDQPAKVSGAARYGLDVRRPGQRFAAIRQCPVYGGKLAEVDEEPARAAGALQVVRLPDAVAVVAKDTWTAFKAARALQPRWTTPAQRLDGARLEALLEANQDAPDSVVRTRAQGDAKQVRADIRAAIATAPRKVEATYFLPYIAHATLEPMNATAEVTPDAVRLWTPTQAQTDLRNAVAKALGRPVEQVQVETTLLGGGFGRRLQPDFAVQAALIARATHGPVQLVWTREEDLAHDFYRPACRLTYRAALAPDGAITAMEAVGATTDDVATGSSSPPPYEAGPFTVTQKQVAAGVPVGAWRSVDATITGFAKECFIDECAAASGLDPLTYRRRLLGRNPRALRLLDAVAEQIGWGPRPAGHGVGLSVFEGWGTLVAHAVEVELEGDTLRVGRIVAAGDPGTIVNPQQVRAQWEGAALQALSVAMGEAVTFTGGAADQANFDRYRLLRMRQAPPVTVLLFETPEAPVGGVGEPGTPGVPAALANAIFAASGRRIRTLPLTGAGFRV